MPSHGSFHSGTLQKGPRIVANPFTSDGFPCQGLFAKAAVLVGYWRPWDAGKTHMTEVGVVLVASLKLVNEQIRVNRGINTPKWYTLQERHTKPGIVYEQGQPLMS